MDLRKKKLNKTKLLSRSPSRSALSVVWRRDAHLHDWRCREFEVVVVAAVGWWCCGCGGGGANCREEKKKK